MHQRRVAVALREGLRLRLPTAREVTTVVGGYQATLEVEYLFERCPNIDMVVRGEGEEIIKQIVTGVPFEEIRGLSYRRDGRIVHNENQVLPDLTHIAFPDRSLRRHDYYWTLRSAFGSAVTRSIRS